METVRKGKALKDPAKWEEFKAIMKKNMTYQIGT